MNTKNQQTENFKETGRILYDAEIIKGQKEAAYIQFKRDARLRALGFAPSLKQHTDGRDLNLTAHEKIAEAEIIYQWLIKDL